MRKFKLVGLVVISVSLGLLGSLYIANNKSTETYEDITVKENKELLSMMLETEAGSGKYQETTASSWPTDGYTFNETLSKCENGGTLSWDSTNKKVIMEGNSSDKCYVYFDVARYDQICDETMLACHVAKQYTGTQGGNNLYLHDSTLENGANDGSYRYAGSSETTNNFVCFGYDSTNGTCPTDYLYRIIGVFDNQVKLIKYDYATSSLLGTDGSCFANSSFDIDLYKGELTNLSACENDWGVNSEGMFQKNLNTNLLNSIGSKWSNKIATYKWKMEYDIEIATPSVTYTNEITSTSADTTYDAKIGLIYASEYGFAAAPSAWTLILSKYDSVTSDNWMYMGLKEYMMGVLSDLGTELHMNGRIIFISLSDSDGMAVRPTFYLNSDVAYVSGSGTISSPYILS